MEAPILQSRGKLPEKFNRKLGCDRWELGEEDPWSFVTDFFSRLRIFAKRCSNIKKISNR